MDGLEAGPAADRPVGQLVHLQHRGVVVRFVAFIGDNVEH
jgi:hypothetical protein